MKIYSPCPATAVHPPYFIIFGATNTPKTPKNDEIGQMDNRNQAK